MPIALSVSIDLQNVICHAQSDGLIEGATPIPDLDSKPYLLTVFFKVDGELALLTDEFKLSGAATVVPTPGTHGNLGDVDVGSGAAPVPIPSAIGEFSTLLRPIALPEPCDALLPDGIPGVVGVLCILLEHDNVTDAGAEAGHQALNAAVQVALDTVVNTRSIDNPGVSDEEIAAIADQIRQAITDAIVEQQSLVENLFTFPNPDDVLGFQVFVFDGAQLADEPVKMLSARFVTDDGANDWEITGRVTAGTGCPVSTLARLERSVEQQADLAALRDFRTELRRQPRIGAWLSLLSRHTGPLAATLDANPALRSSAVDLVVAASAALKSRDTVLAPAQLAAARKILDAVIADSPRRARRDLTLLRALLPVVEGKTPNQALAELATLRPTITRRSTPTRRLVRSVKES